MAPANILTINGGSSSIKVDFFGAHRADSFSVQAKLIGQRGTTLEIKDGSMKSSLEINSQLTYLEVAQLVFAQVQKRGLEVHGVGHRLVHGGPFFAEATVIDDRVFETLEQLRVFDELHMAPALGLVELAREEFAGVVHVACFDTSFFNDLPLWAKTLPLPHELMQKGYKKYGFHGLAYESVSQQFGRICGDDARMGRVLYMHLGSGASLASVAGGHPIDTTMVVSTNSGFAMSTRSGSIDPGIIELLHKKDNFEYDEIFTMLAHESGLKGVSGLSADMYKLIVESDTNDRASLAVEKFVHDVAMSAGGLVVAMGGLDSIVFSGGIGENSAPIRERICEKLEHLGVEIDVGRNRQGERYIAGDHSRVGVHVIPADEARVIAQNTHELYQQYSEGN